MTIDPREFRNTLARFATGIVVVTSVDSENRPVGVTVNAFSSLSLDPPLILFCAGKSGRSAEALVSCKAFAVNILSAEQRHLSDLFASRSDDKFAGLTVELGENGCALLPGSLAWLECRRETVHDGGDHTIVIGHVDHVHYAEKGNPLLYFNSAYAGIGGPL